MLIKIGTYLPDSFSYIGTYIIGKDNLCFWCAHDSWYYARIVRASSIKQQAAELNLC